MSDPRTLLVLTNAAAGSAGEAPVDQALAVLRSGARVETLQPQELGGQAQRLREAPAAEVVVMGGDGSVHAALQQLVDADLLAHVASLAIVPLGTGNDFARTLGLPLDAEAAARVALEGDLLDLDLLQDDEGGVVVNAVHVGVAAEATAHAQEVKGRFGVAAYALGAVRAGIGSDGWRLRVSVDDEVVVDGTREVLMVTLAMGGTIGGGTRVAPRARPSDGLVEVVISSATSWPARASFALDLRAGRHVDRADVTVLRGRTVRVESLHPHERFRVNTDGDVAGHVSARSWRVLEDVWRCRVPAGSRSLPEAPQG